MRVQTLPSWWSRFWFSDGSPHALAATRIISAIQSLWILLSRDPAAASALPPEFWAAVPRSTQWRYVVFPGHPALEYVVYTLTVAILIAAALGIRPRVTCLASALALFHLAGLDAIVWQNDPAQRGLEVAILALVVLAFAPCTDVWSVGARRRAGALPSATWTYRWPLRLVQLFVVQTYLFSGYGKLANAGFAWISGENIRGWLLLMNEWAGVGMFDSLGPFLAGLPAVPLLIAVGAVVLEFTFPIVLFWPASRRVIIPLTILFHLGIAFAMNLAFPNTGLLLVFVNWDWVRKRLQGGIRTADLTAAIDVPQPS